MKFIVGISSGLSLMLLAGMGAAIPCAAGTPQSSDPIPRTVAITRSQPGAEADLLGLWQGTLAIPGSPLRLVINIENQEVGGTDKAAYKATLTSPDQTPQPFPASKIEIMDGTLRWEVKSLGHSEGGLIAPLVASQKADVAFIVMMAGPGMPGGKLLLLQGDLIAKAAGTPETKLAQSHPLRHRLIETVTTETDAGKRQEKLDVIGADQKNKCQKRTRRQSET